MWQILCVYLLDGVAQKQFRTHYPPLLGDRLMMGELGEVIVVERIWKQHFTEQQILDIVIKKMVAVPRRVKK